MSLTGNFVRSRVKRRPGTADLISERDFSTVPCSKHFTDSGKAKGLPLLPRSGAFLWKAPKCTLGLASGTATIFRSVFGIQNRSWDIFCRVVISACDQSSAAVSKRDVGLLYLRIIVLFA